MKKIAPNLILLLLILPLAACDMIGQKFGLEDQARKEARLEPEAKAVGSACRQSGRAIEDCYSIYSWLPKAGIFAGWKEMDGYMRENELATIEPQLPPPEPPGTKKKKKPEPAPSEEGSKADEKPEKPAEKAADKPAEKH